MGADNNVELVSFDDLFARSDVLSIHVPLTDLNRGGVTSRELGLMKPTAFLVNTSSGPIVEEDALLSALCNEQIADATLDVYDLEPLPADSPFLALDTVLLSPHLGYSTERSFKNFFLESIKNLQAWLDGSPINVLNPEVLAD